MTPTRKSHNLDQLISVIYGINDLDLFYDLTLDLLLNSVDASAGSLFIWDEFKKEFILKAVRGPYRDRVNNAHIKLREGILGWVGGQGSSVLVTDIDGDRRFQSLNRVGHYRTASFISLSLIANNQLIGVINITEREDFTPFDEEDHEQSQVMARHIAIAYANLRRLNRLKEENLQLHDQVDKLRQTLRDNEPLVSLGKLAANLTHELNNPLDAIRRYVNLALDKSLQDSLTKEYLLKAKKAIRRAIRVIRHLIHFSTEHKSVVRVIEIHALIEESLEALSDGRYSDIVIQKKFNAGSSYILDRGLSMVFHNLFQNSGQAMAGKGSISISTRRKNSDLEIEVEDSGPGIPRHLHSHLFEPFFSTKEKGQGMGLGLTLCKETVERHGGKISYDPTLSSGARFRITLPCKSDGEAA